MMARVKKRTRQDILAMSIHQIFKEEIFFITFGQRRFQNPKQNVEQR